MLETSARSFGWEDPLEEETVFLTGEFHGQRSLAGYSLWGCTEPNTAEQLTRCYYNKPAAPDRDPWDCILPGSSVHGIFQSRILEWVAITFSREYIYIGFLGGSYCKESACHAGDLGSIPGSKDLLETVGHNCATYTHTQTHIKKRESQREQTFIL